MFIDYQCAEQMEKGRAKRRRKRSGGGEETGWGGEETGWGGEETGWEGERGEALFILVRLSLSGKMGLFSAVCNCL